MKILWITSVLLNDVSIDCYGNPGNGLWIEPLLPEFRKNTNDELHIIFFQNETINYHSRINGINYYVFTEIKTGSDNVKLCEYKRILSRLAPDVIHIWGTEKKRNYYLFLAAKELNIPCVFFIQGLLHEIAIHSEAGFSKNERIRYTTLRDVYRKQTPLMEKKYWEKLSKHEVKILSMGINFMYENQWCVAHCREYNTNSCGYKVNLPLNPLFWEREKQDYQIKKEEVSILCNASGYPLKGLHITLKAIARLKKKYPNIKLYVPGKSLIVPTGIINRQKYPGYHVYVSKLIKEFGLSENVVFLGCLTQTELADRILASDVFILSSSLENHASSLIEAMALGMPCVTAYIDGLVEYVENFKNILTYRFGDVELLALYIEHLIENRDFAEKIGRAARMKIIEDDARQPQMIYQQMISCYEALASQKGGK